MAVARSESVKTSKKWYKVRFLTLGRYCRIKEGEREEVRERGGGSERVREGEREGVREGGRV